LKAPTKAALPVEPALDTDLVRSAMRGDERAFTALVNSVADRFLGVAHRILRDATLAEDAVQQALLGAWRDLPDLRDPARFEGWAYRLLVRACYMEARKRRRWYPTTIARSIAEPSAPDLIGGIIERERLERGFERLSVDHRSVLVLVYYLDLPSEQVAEALDVPVGTVYSRLHRAQQALRSALEADERVPRTTTATQATR
jgi:RNA polymerase sigma-70 factor (ECF subfamily)